MDRVVTVVTYSDRSPLDLLSFYFYVYPCYTRGYSLCNGMDASTMRRSASTTSQIYRPASVLLIKYGRPPKQMLPLRATLQEKMFAPSSNKDLPPPPPLPQSSITTPFP